MKKYSVLLLINLLCFQQLQADDWPEFRNDSQRSATTDEKLSDQLHLSWVRQFPKPNKAWKDASNASLGFDKTYEAVAKGKLIYVNSMVEDTMSAFDTDSGELKWRFVTEGPVRFAACLKDDMIFFTSDDGYLYCLEALTGKLKWKFRGGPLTNKVLGNERFVGMWPARSGPAIHDDKIYFAAGIWPFMGIFYHCLDTKTGEVIWTNSGSAQEYMKQPHSAPAYASIAPQGYLSTTEKYMLVTSGRTHPAVYDRLTGKFLNFYVSKEKGPKSYYASTHGEHFLCHGKLYDFTSGKTIFNGKTTDLIVGDTVYTVDRGKLSASAFPPKVLKKYKDKRGREKTVMAYSKKWSVDMGDSWSEIAFKTPDKLYGFRMSTSSGVLKAIKLSENNSKEVWSQNIDGRPSRMLTADGKVFVITLEGALYCYADKKSPVKKHEVKIQKYTAEKGKWGKLVSQLPKEKTNGGAYCIVMGVESGGLINALLSQTKMKLVVLESSEKKANAEKIKLLDAGLYGRRVSVHVGDYSTYVFPQYVAEYIVSESKTILSDKETLINIYKALRPYGGSIYSTGSLASPMLENIKAGKTGGWNTISREGALTDSANWTHQYGGPERSMISDEKRVKLPLGLLWWGGPSNDEVLPRHGHGPNPQVMNGRLVIQGRNMLRCLDIYTGRLLWQQTKKNLGKYYDNKSHHPGANEIGSNYVTREDHVYVMFPDRCELLDPATGEVHKTFKLPVIKDESNAHWGSIVIYGDVLVATAVPVTVTTKSSKGKSGGGNQSDLTKIKGVSNNDTYGAGSRYIFGLHRQTGKVLWKRQAKLMFRHNCITLANNMAFFIDGINDTQISALKRRGYKHKISGVLYAVDIKTGKILWQTDKNVSGTWLAYSKKNDILMQTGSRFRDRARDESGKGYTCYKGKTGQVIWENLNLSIQGPPILWQDEFFTNGSAGGKKYSLLTGKELGKQWSRAYGCNSAIGCQNFLTFRTGSAGFSNLLNDGGTGNLGGFKSSCTSNMIPAGGMLTIPDYTRTCSCAYQVQSSVGLVHMPSIEMWTKWKAETPSESGVKAVGVNLSAVGNRKSDEGSYWYSTTDKKTSRLKVSGDSLKLFRDHSLYYQGKGLTWVASSGYEGVEEVELVDIMSGMSTSSFTLRLYFSEPDLSQKKGGRVFSVSLNGKKIITKLDIFSESKGHRKVLMKEFKKIKLKKGDKLTFDSSKGETLICGVEVIEGSK
jgi:outer membrane protein assembly factor BamB